jgi:SAM-dependent methyltransferase
MPPCRFQYLIAARHDVSSLADSLAYFEPVWNGSEAAIYRFSGRIPESLHREMMDAGLSETRLMDCAYFIQQRNRLIQQALYIEFFDYIGDDYESLIDVNRNSGNISVLLDLLRQRIGNLAGKILLDFGCGTGLAITQLQAAKARFIGVDQSPHMLDIARCRGMEAIDVAALNSWGSRFDGAIASYVLHLVSDEAVIKAVASSLKSGATLVGNFHKGANVEWVDRMFNQFGCSALHFPQLGPETSHGMYVGFTKK